MSFVTVRLAGLPGLPSLPNYIAACQPSLLLLLQLVTNALALIVVGLIYDQHWGLEWNLLLNLMSMVEKMVSPLEVTAL